MPRGENHKVSEISDGKQVPQLKIGVGGDPFDLKTLESQYELLVALKGSDILDDKSPFIKVRERAQPFSNLLTIEVKGFSGGVSESFANHFYDCHTKKYQKSLLNGSWDHTLLLKHGPSRGYGGKVVFLPRYNSYQQTGGAANPPFVVVIEPKALGSQAEITQKKFSGLGKHEIQGCLILDRFGDYILCLVDCREKTKKSNSADFSALLEALTIEVYGHKTIQYGFSLNGQPFGAPAIMTSTLSALPVLPSPLVLPVPLEQPHQLQTATRRQRKRSLPGSFEAYGFSGKRARIIESPIASDYSAISQTVSAETLAEVDFANALEPIDELDNGSDGFALFGQLDDFDPETTKDLFEDEEDFHFDFPFDATADAFRFD